MYRACINARMIDAQQRGAAPAGVTMPVLAELTREVLIEVQELHEGGWAGAVCGWPLRLAVAASWRPGCSGSVAAGCMATGCTAWWRWQFPPKAVCATHSAASHRASVGHLIALSTR